MKHKQFSLTSFRVAVNRLSFLALCAASTLNLAAMSVSLTSSVESSAPLGTAIAFSAAVSGAAPGTLVYAFRVRPLDGAFRTVVDYGPNSSLAWTTIQREGAYVIEVSAKNKDTGDEGASALTFTFTSLVAGGAPAVTPTANPLVFIYSAPPCPSGSRIRVKFQALNGIAQDTPWAACHPGHSMNFYLAGMRANTQFSASHSIDSGTSVSQGPAVSFATSDSPIQPTAATLLTTGKTPSVDGILLQSIIGFNSIATDLAGNIVWYSPADISFLTRPEAGGTFLAIGESETQDPPHQFFREFDLAGITLAETNAARVNEQLNALGAHAINGFHHEARKLQNGNYLVLADSERMLTDVQGPGAVDVIGDTILVLNRNLQVIWAWDSFDHLDTSRMAVLGETCTAPNPGCAPWYLATTANDWLHGNSLQLTPDGNILYSARHQDWLIKIDYQNGAGSGAILWRLGNAGDFQIVSTDPSPWFSHQHDANFAADDTSLTVFDDGNSRRATDPTAHSRGQALVIDEPNRVANLIVNADLGAYSSALGSAQKLPNGDYHFDCGFIQDPSGNGKLIAQSLEVNAAGTIVYGIQFGTIEYRSFRMRDMFTMR